jgi:hypothetical protein
MPGNQAPAGASALVSASPLSDCHPSHRHIVAEPSHIPAESGDCAQAPPHPTRRPPGVNDGSSVLFLLARDSRQIR